jgi:hypothetical protein
MTQIVKSPAQEDLNLTDDGRVELSLDLENMQIPCMVRRRIMEESFAYCHVDDRGAVCEKLRAAGFSIHNLWQSNDAGDFVICVRRVLQDDKSIRLADYLGDAKSLQSYLAKNSAICEQNGEEGKP